jgi:hypothetical protein
MWVAVVVLLVAALCAAWFAVAHQQTQAAERDLEASTVTVADLKREQDEYSDTVRLKTRTETLERQLKAVMANDLDWNALLDTVRFTGIPSDITVKGVNGRLNDADGASTPGSNPLPSTSTTPPIGSLVVTGTAPDKRAVASYVDALAKETTVANPYVTSVVSEEESGDVTFSLRADITQAALCGRFTTQCTGGK